MSASTNLRRHALAAFLLIWMPLASQESLPFVQGFETPVPPGADTAGWKTASIPGTAQFNYVRQSSEASHGGTYSLKFITQGKLAAYEYTGIFKVSKKSMYSVSAWVKFGESSEGNYFEIQILQCDDKGNIGETYSRRIAAKGNDWQFFEIAQFIPPDKWENFKIRLVYGGNAFAGICFVDDVAVREFPLTRIQTGVPGRRVFSANRDMPIPLSIESSDRVLTADVTVTDHLQRIAFRQNGFRTGTVAYLNLEPGVYEIKAKTSRDMEITRNILVLRGGFSGNNVVVPAFSDAQVGSSLIGEILRLSGVSNARLNISQPAPLEKIRDLVRETPYVNWQLGLPTKIDKETTEFLKSKYFSTLIASSYTIDHLSELQGKSWIRETDNPRSVKDADSAIVAGLAVPDNAFKNYYFDLKEPLDSKSAVALFHTAARILLNSKAGIFIPVNTSDAFGTEMLLVETLNSHLAGRSQIDVKGLFTGDIRYIIAKGDGETIMILWASANKHAFIPGGHSDEVFDIFGAKIKCGESIPVSQVPVIVHGIDNDAIDIASLVALEDEGHPGVSDYRVYTRRTATKKRLVFKNQSRDKLTNLDIKISTASPDLAIKHDSFTEKEIEPYKEYTGEVLMLPKFPSRTIDVPITISLKMKKAGKQIDITMERIISFISVFDCPVTEESDGNDRKISGKITSTLEHPVSVKVTFTTKFGSRKSFVNSLTSTRSAPVAFNVRNAHLLEAQEKWYEIYVEEVGGEGNYLLIQNPLK